MRGRTAKCTQFLALVAALALPRAALAEISTVLLSGDAGSACAFGWGLHVEAPVAGVLANTPAHRQAAWGSQLGLAVAVELLPHLELRAQVTQGQASAGSMAISYASGNNRPFDTELAQWRATLAALGVAYVWSHPDRPWELYAGADAVGGYGGYALVYTDAVAKNLEVTPTQAQSRVPTPHLADGALWGAGARGGLRLRLNAWLSTQTEVGVVLLPLSAVPVTNNRDIRDVRTVPHVAILPYAAFSIRVSL